MKTKFTKAEIRKFMVLYQGLNELDQFGQGKEGVLHFFEHVHNIQMDPLNIVGINPEIMLQSRFSQFHPELLQEMLYQDYSLVDGFDKEAAIYLMEDWGKFDLVRKKLTLMDWKVLDYRKNLEAGRYLDVVYNYILEHPHTTSQAIKIEGGIKTSWGSASLSNCALNHLWCEGKIVISQRKERIKKYADRGSIVPIAYQTFPFESETLFLDWYVMRRLDSMGFYWLKKSAGWQAYYLHDMKILKVAIERLLDQEMLIVIQIEEMKEDFYMTKNAYQFLIKSLKQDLLETVRFIAPLDNLIWDRNLIIELFHFEYVWEVYKPVGQRKYGYYVLPVLYKDKFVARIEPSRNKERKHTFEIENIWYEDGVNEADLKKLIDQEVLRYNKTFRRK